MVFNLFFFCCLIQNGHETLYNSSFLCYSCQFHFTKHTFQKKIHFKTEGLVKLNSFYHVILFPIFSQIFRYLDRNLDLEQIEEFAFYGVIQGPTHL